MAVIKGKIRGNGSNLGWYLLAPGENEEIRLIDVDGMEIFNEKDFRNLLRDMSLNEQLTKSRKGIYHGMINPDLEEAKTLTDKEWLEAVDIMAEELGFAGQRKAVVLHKKLDRWHAHIAWERYDRGLMIPIDHNYRKQDKARAKIEQRFNLKPTVRRNPKRPLIKEEMTAIWKATADGRSFIAAAKKKGFVISAGHEKPFMIVDDTGRSFNLFSHLEKIGRREVRGRMQGLTLIDEKDAIAFIRTDQAVTQSKAKEKDQMNSNNPFLENLAKMKIKQQFKGPRMR